MPGFTAGSLGRTKQSNSFVCISLINYIMDAKLYHRFASSERCLEVESWWALKFSNLLCLQKVLHFTFSCVTLSSFPSPPLLSSRLKRGYESCPLSCCLPSVALLRAVLEESVGSVDRALHCPLQRQWH